MAYANLERRRQTRKAYRAKNRMRINEQNRVSAQRVRALDPEKSRAYFRNWFRQKRAKDVSFRIAGTLRVRLGKLVKGERRTSGVLGLLGCSLEYFLSRLALCFQPGMSWENYGEWEIDHIRPCSKFDLIDPAQQKECFHYTNLQPLWKLDNRRKSNKG